MAGEINAVGTVGTVTRRDSKNGAFYTMPITINGTVANFSAWDAEIQKAEDKAIEFVYTEKIGAGGRVYRNINKGWSFLPASQQVSVAGVPEIGYDNKLYTPEQNRQESIVRQSSLKAALEFMRVLSDNGALGISKTKAAKDPEVLMELVKQFAIQFKDFVDNSSWENIWDLPIKVEGELQANIEGDDIPF